MSRSLPVSVAVMPCSDGDNAGDAESLAKAICTALELRPKSGLKLKWPHSWNFLFASPPVDQVRKGEQHNTVTLCSIHALLPTLARADGPLNYQNLYN